jgi:hypothetical protein
VHQFAPAWLCLADVDICLGRIVDIAVSVAGAGPADQLRDLYAWLTKEPELTGQIRLHERDGAVGELGPLTDLVQAALEPGGAVSAFAAAVVAWLKFRTADVKITVSRADGTTHTELAARRVKSLDAAGTQVLARELAQSLTRDGSHAR